MTQEKELLISVDTLGQTEQALKRLDSLESNAKVSQYLQITALICRLFVPDRFATNTYTVHVVDVSMLALSGGDGSGSDHHPSRTPAVSQSPLRHGSYYTALQRASPLL